MLLIKKKVPTQGKGVRNKEMGLVTKMGPIFEEDYVNDVLVDVPLSLYMCVYVCICVCIYIYIYIKEECFNLEN